MSHAPSIHLKLLGPFQIRRTAAQASPRIGRKTRAILAYLAVSEGPYERRELSNLFCQRADDPAGALRWHLSRIRRQVDDRLILTEGTLIHFNKDAADLDVARFSRVLAASLSDPDPETLEETLSLYRGEFLAGLSLPDSPEFELWLLAERARLGQLYERGLLAHVRHLTRAARYLDATRWARRLVQHNPLLEDGHARLSWLYACTGQREAALEQIESCEQLLRDELGVELSPALRDLRDEIIGGEGPRPLASLQDLKLPASPETVGFVGRSGQLESLYQAWNAARQGRGGVVLIEAEAGGGKTRLVQEFVWSLTEAVVLTERCFESSRSLPYHPWIQILEDHLKRLDKVELESIAPIWVDYLIRLVPSLGPLLDRRVPPAPPVRGGEVGRLFNSVAEVLFLREGLIVFVDDLQWADEASLALFHFLARRVPDEAVLLIGTYRHEEAEAGAALHTLSADLERQTVTRLVLPPLTLPEVRELTEQLWPALAPGYRPHVCAMLMRETGGNPFLVTEVVQELAHTTEVPDSVPVPAGVRDLVRRRLSQLPEGVRQVIEALAVLDVPTAPALAQRISARSQEETHAAIDQGLRRGLLRAEDEAHPGQYGFRHDLIRQAVAMDLSEIRRQLLHRRTARLLESGETSPAQLFYHWRMAGDLQREGRYALLAGEQAADSYANEEAIRCLKRAAQICEASSDRIRAEMKLGEVKQLIGQWDEAEEHIQRALRTASESEDTPARARCLTVLGQMRTQRGMFAEALELLEEAQDLFEQIEDQAGLGEATGNLGLVYWYLGDYPQALKHLERRLTIAREVGDQNSAGIAIGNLGIVYWSQGDYEQALACYQEKLRMDTETGDRLSASRAVGNMGLVYRDQGDYAGAMQSYIHKLEIDGELGDRLGVSFALENMGDLYNRQGQYELALVCIGHSLDIALKLESRKVVTVALGRLIDAYSGLRDFDRLERVAQQAIALSRTVNIPRKLCSFLQTLATLYVDQGRPKAAIPLAEEAASLARQVQRQDILFFAELLQSRLRAAADPAAKPTVISELESMLSQWTEKEQQAALHEAIWALAPEKERHRAEAAHHYRELYNRTPDAHFRQRYEALTGERLPEPPPLPNPAELVQGEQPDLEALLERVDHLLTSLDSEAVSA